MKTHMQKFGLLAAMIMTGMGVAHADSTVVVSGSVAETTCSVSLDQNELNLGNVAPTDIQASGTLYQGQDVTATLTNCSGEGVGKQAKIRLTGPVATSLGTSYFNTEANPTVGVVVIAKGTADNALLTNASTVNIGDATTDAIALNGMSQAYTIGLGSTVPTPNAGLAKATLTFDYFYN